MVKVLEDQNKLLSSPSVKGEAPLVQKAIAKRGSLPPELPSMTKSKQKNVNTSNIKRTLNGGDLRTNPYTDLVVTSFASKEEVVAGAAAKNGGQQANGGLQVICIDTNQRRRNQLNASLDRVKIHDSHENQPH